MSLPSGPDRWATIPPGPIRVVWFRGAGMFLSTSPLHFPKVRHSIHPLSPDISNGFQSCRRLE